jgi:hypothetical protein
VTVSSDVPEALAMVAGLKLARSPAVLLAVRPTVPVKPPIGLRVMVEFAVPLCDRESEVEEADTEKFAGEAGVDTASSAEFGPSPVGLEAETT